jgi:hypothetical protein
MTERFVRTGALTLALYGFAAWVYVALSAIVAPETLHLPLTHFTNWPRQDTFGAASFAVSLVSCWIYLLLRKPPQ